MANGTLAASQLEMLSQDGTGIVTINPPDTNTNRTLTLPDSTGTIATTADIPAAYTDTDALDLFNASGSAPVFAARAWVNFNGTGTVAIRASGNVSSITDNGTGNYTVNFTTAMPDANYAVAGTAMRASDNSSSGAAGLDICVKGDSTFGNSFSTTNARVLSKLYNDTMEDALAVTVAFFR